MFYVENKCIQLDVVKKPGLDNQRIREDQKQ